MIEVKHLTKIYNHTKKAVDNLSFTINGGEIFAFIGHNGAGKTTTIKSIMGIIEFDKGDILVNGQSIKTHPVECKLQMAYVPDNPDLYDNLRAIKFIDFVCDMYETPLDVRRPLIEKYAKLFDIEAQLSSEISSFSHGMKQKVALIAALSHDPDILIMDEPFVGLDPKAVFDLKAIMKDFAAQGKTILFSTHILDVAEKLCSKVAIIKQGHLVACGSMASVKKNKSLEEVFLEVED